MHDCDMAREIAIFFGTEYLGQQVAKLTELHMVSVGDQRAYSEAQAKLKRGIREAKQKYKQRIEDQLNSNNPRSMWNGIKVLTDYKTTRQPLSDDANLPDVLNQFFACFDTQRGETAPLIITPAGESTLVLQHHQVRTTLRKVNVRKAAGPDGVPARVLK
ncbi:hypothetical protein SKAU_G00138630 [Synaphobranchus kaupii]|uniref:Uncharacterized protein n=1 Tax=Synaphobranchus kaupii TaxID=118154 RepID=A0A9Q1FRX1_SYNKA|nr:hypothetical protein SKAU_G00138630 [Synaphobranchus kaupii]